MPDATLSARSGLEHVLVPGRHGAPDGEAGVTLTLREPVAIAAVVVRRGLQGELVARVRNAFGLELPMTPRRVVAEAATVVWAGPGRWLAVADGMACHMFEQRLRNELVGLASVCDQSDARVLTRVQGVRARDMLAKGVMIDLHPRAFGPGDAAIAAIGHIGVHVWQIDSAATYEVAVGRSLAAELWRWFFEAGAEYGVKVEDRTS